MNRRGFAHKSQQTKLQSHNKNGATCENQIGYKGKKRDVLSAQEAMFRPADPAMQNPARISRQISVSIHTLPYINSQPYGLHAYVIGCDRSNKRFRSYLCGIPTRICVLVRHSMLRGALLQAGRLAQVARQPSTQHPCGPLAAAIQVRDPAGRL